VTISWFNIQYSNLSSVWSN